MPVLPFIVVYASFFPFSFLLGKHKAAIEVYHEAGKLNEKDWVREKIVVSSTQ